MQNYQFNIFLYFFLLGTAVWCKNPTMIVLMVVLGVIILISIPLYRSVRTETIKTDIKNVIDNNFKEPVLDINKAAWWEFAQLPNISKVQAKKMVWIRKHTGFYTSIEDYCIKNSISNKELIEKLVKM